MAQVSEAGLVVAMISMIAGGTFFSSGLAILLIAIIKAH